MTDLTLETGSLMKIKGTADFSSGTVTFRSQQVARTAMLQETESEYAISLSDARIHDDTDTILPETAATDDLGYIEGTFGTDALTLQTSDAKATTVTQYGRFPQVPVPADYVAGGTLRLRVRAGMITTISDTSATVDIEAYALDGDGSVGSDLCTTSAQTINSLVKDDEDFTITATALEPGDLLDIRTTVAITDSATGTVVIGEISKLTWLYTRY